jgi:hypothetical protein
MRSYAGFGQPRPIIVLQRVFRHSSIFTGLRKPARYVFAISFVVTTLVALPIVGNGWSPVAHDHRSSGITVIFKNQVHPSIDKPKARAAETDCSDQTNGDKGLVFHGQGQWI